MAPPQRNIAVLTQRRCVNFFRNWQYQEKRKAKQVAWKPIQKGGMTMPTYEFVCEKCKKRFTLILKIAEYEKKDFRCPKCKSKKVTQKIAGFQTITSKKS
jgi:putative FmdB family regulatory protein